MLTVLLILIPLITGLITFGTKGPGAKVLSLLSSLASLVITVIAWTQFETAPDALQFTVDWIPQLGTQFNVGMDGMGLMLCLLTTISFPLIFITIFSREYERAGAFLSLIHI